MYNVILDAKKNRNKLLAEAQEEKRRQQLKTLKGKLRTLKLMRANENIKVMRALSGEGNAFIDQTKSKVAKTFGK